MRKEITIGFVLALGMMLLSVTAWAGEAPGSPQVQGTTASYQFYNSANFPHLTDPNPVYRSVTYDQLTRLFQSEGTYMILFGGSWCGNTQAVIGQINDVAKEYNVEAIYNFDFRLDGRIGSLHIRDTRNEYANLYVDMVNTYLPNIVTLYDKAENNVGYTNEAGETVVANKAQVPFLFIYNKDNRDANGNPAPVIASYERMLRWEQDFQTDGVDDSAKIEAYKAEIRPLFDLVSTTSIGGNKTAQLDTYSDFEYYRTAFNDRAGTTILDDSDLPWTMQTVSYFELTKLLESEGTYALMFGGPWCGNTQAVIKFVNEYANKYGITNLYTFDTKLDSNQLQIRDTRNPYAKMYVDLVRTYFPGIITENQIESRNISYIDENGNEVIANRLQVPYVFLYNKDHVDSAGNPDPILGQIELMYRWADIQPDYKDENGVVGDHYETYTAALDDLYSLIDAP